MKGRKKRRNSLFIRKITAPATIWSRICPASILANRRIARERGLRRKDIISMTTKIGINQRGIFLGKKIPKNPTPKWVKPTMIQAKKKQRERLRVIMIWEERVKENGNRPNRLKVRIRQKNRKDYREKFTSPMSPLLHQNVIDKEVKQFHKTLPRSWYKGQKFLSGME